MLFRLSLLSLLMTAPPLTVLADLPGASERIEIQIDGPEIDLDRNSSVQFCRRLITEGNCTSRQLSRSRLSMGHDASIKPFEMCLDLHPYSYSGATRVHEDVIDISADVFHHANVQELLRRDQLSCAEITFGLRIAYYSGGALIKSDWISLSDETERGGNLFSHPIRHSYFSPEQHYWVGHLSIRRH